MKETLGSPLLIRYQKAYEENPGSRVFAPLAEVYRKMGMLDKAQEILLKGIQIHPDYVLGHLGLAQCYGDLSQYEEVYKTLSPFVQTFRDNIKLQKLFARACEKTQRQEEALETWKYLLFLNPRDEKVAEMVHKLESRLVDEAPRGGGDEFSAGDIEENVPLTGAQSFDVDKIKSNPEEYDYDDWRQEDFAFSKNFSPEEDSFDELEDDEWSMTNVSEETLDKGDTEEEEERIFHVDASLIKKEVVEEDLEGPVITHTLVDLYCSQGHLEKAKEILEKIIQLNPQDQKTRTRLEELNEMLLGESTSLSGVEDDDYEEDELLSEIENSDTLKDQNTNLMDYFDQKIQEASLEELEVSPAEKKQKLENFLAKIKQRAEEVSKSDSGATL